MYIKVYKRLTTYWIKLLCPENNIVCIIYRYFCTQYKDGFKTPWIDCIQRILNMCRLPNIWNEQGYVVNIKWLSATVNQILKDQFIQM